MMQNLENDRRLDVAGVIDRVDSSGGPAITTYNETAIYVARERRAAISVFTGEDSEA